MTQQPQTATEPLSVAMPVMLAPILLATDGKPSPITHEQVVAVIRRAADSATQVLPPRTARMVGAQLREVSATAEHGGNVAWFVVKQWLHLVDEINALAATTYPEYELRRPDGDVHGTDDIGSAVDFVHHVWPDARIYRRTCTTIRGEWTEVTG